MRFPSGVPVQVCQASDSNTNCGNGGGSGVNWNNIGGNQLGINVSDFNWQNLTGINPLNTANINFEGIQLLIPTQLTGDNTNLTASDAFVTTAINNLASTLYPATAVQAIAVTALNKAPVYSNGSSGVGATLSATINGTLNVDGYTLLLNDRLLVNGQTTTYQNGVYSLTTLGSAGTEYVLTRTSDFNTVTAINNAGSIPVTHGTTYINTQWVLHAQIANIGVSTILYDELSTPVSLVSMSGINWDTIPTYSGNVNWYGMTFDNFGTNWATVVDLGTQSVNWYDINAIIGSLNVINNVGIGSISPGQALDVKGTIRTTGFTLSNNNASNGYVLVGNNVGVGTWEPASTLPETNYWLNDAGNVGINTSYNVGIGTISQVNLLNVLGNVGIGTFSYDPYMINSAPNGGMIVSGNVGLGTWEPRALLDVQGTLSVASFGGNVGIGTWLPQSNLQIGAGNTGVYVNNSGNVSIGTTALTSALCVGSSCQFNVSSTGQIVTSQTAAIQLSAQNPTIKGTSTSAGMLTLTGNNNQAGGFLLETTGKTGNGDQGLIQWGNNGIGTEQAAFQAGGVGIGTYASQYILAGTEPKGGLATQGNIGIGTWIANSGLQIAAGLNEGIGSITPSAALDVNGSVRMTGFQLTTTPGSGYVLTSNNVGVGTWYPASGGGGGSGTVSSGSANQVGYYSSAGTTISGATNFVFNGTNVGIGTVLTNGYLNAINLSIGTAYAGYNAPPSNGIAVQGNVGVSTYLPAAGLDVETSGTSYFSSNVGIGSSTPGQILDVNGTIRTLSITSRSPTCATIGPIGTCWTSTGQLGYCSGAANVCSTCTAC